MKCTKCGYNVSNDDFFCSNCGSKIIKKNSDFGQNFLIGFIFLVIIYSFYVFLNFTLDSSMVEMNQISYIIMAIIMLLSIPFCLIILPLVILPLQNK
ncbi:MAG: DUF983 domain-containing protein [Tenericutes bacterium]|nr:DUF983 domain-containing protein [Mycoplasmatota bacterium]